MSEKAVRRTLMKLTTVSFKLSQFRHFFQFRIAMRRSAKSGQCSGTPDRSIKRQEELRRRKLDRRNDRHHRWRRCRRYSRRHRYRSGIYYITVTINHFKLPVFQTARPF